MFRSGLIKTLVTHANIKGFGLIPLLGNRRGYMPPLLKTKQKQNLGLIKTWTVLLAKLKNKAGGLSVKQEELDIKSTGARNDYILSLTTANAHRERYHKSDLPVSTRHTIL